MFNPVANAEAVEYRKRQLLREAKVQQLAKELEQDRAKVHERFLAMVGDLMVSGGSRLKKRYEAANQSLSAPVYYSAKSLNS
jgi:hypothetical protein